MTKLLMPLEDFYRYSDFYFMFMTAEIDEMFIGKHNGNFEIKEYDLFDNTYLVKCIDKSSRVYSSSVMVDVVVREPNTFTETIHAELVKRYGV